MYPSIWRRRDASSYGHAATNHVEMSLVTAPTAEPVTLTQVKEQARIPWADSDDILNLYIAMARDAIEGFLGRSLMTQTWDITCDWGPAWIELPKPPIQSVTAVYTTGLDNVEVVVPTSVYITNMPHRLVSLNIGQVWPLHRGKAGFRIRYVSGYSATPNDTSQIPPMIKHEILALAAQFDNTRDQVGIPLAVQSRLDRYRIKGEPFRMARGMAREDLLA